MIYIVFLSHDFKQNLRIMKNNITLSELELPQLRQMVVDNDRRISNNEMQIKEMRMEITEQSQKERERDEWWEESRRKHDSDMREIREMQKAFQRQLVEQSVANDLALKKSREEFDNRLQKSQEAFDKQMRESRARHDQDIAEIKELHKDIDIKISNIGDKIDQMGGKINLMGDKINHLGDKITNMVVEITGVTGHIIEGLVGTTAEKMFQEVGYNLYNNGNNIKRKLTAQNLQMEVDVLLSNSETVIPIEVKTNCTKKNIDQFLKSMEKFRTLFPEYAGHEVIAGIAALNYERGAYDYAQQQGLLVIRVSSDYIFSIAPFEREKLKRF